ncbi:IS3 family transposase [Mycetohabitans sp. B8]|uniref:IS3 family transposase n=1 Tax=Mycetohabitans sp. B8 TaxID=2841845 RepID=UPI0034CF902D|nr:IS3 family transposase [Mycetohabitans sp. B8]
MRGIKARICSNFNQHKGSYEYRRVTAVLQQKGKKIKHKTIQHLMGKPQLKSHAQINKYKKYSI